MPWELTNDELDRFSRQILVNEIGYEGQQRLLASRVTLVAPAGPGRDLAARYLQACGLTVAVEEGDGAVIRYADGFYEIPPNHRVGDFMIGWGLAVAHVIKRIAEGTISEGGDPCGSP
ncbi:MAG: hypothetical protein OWQ57_06805 [Sulfobacillus sp.]|nr:hypothetical protein [Sulfobacillus sp.]